MCGVMLAMTIFVLELYSHSEFLHAFSFVRQFYFCNRIISLIIILLLFLGCCWSLPLLLGFFFFFLGRCWFFFCFFFHEVFQSLPSISHILYHPVIQKEAVSRTLCSLSASASRVAVTGAATALYNFEIVYLKNVFIFYYTFLRNLLLILWTR